MKTTYQPFIIKKAEEVIELLKEEIMPTELAKNYLCDIMTQKFIDGKFGEGDEGVFESDEELFRFINQCEVNEGLAHLYELGLINSFDDCDSFFITEEGKRYMEEKILKT